MARKMNGQRPVAGDEVIGARLRKFIRKYYRIRIFRGLIRLAVAFTVVVLLLILAGNLFAGYAWLHRVLEIAGAAGLAVILILQVLRPAGQALGWLRGLNYREASRIITEKHVSVEDRIINIMELAGERKGSSNPLYGFAIDQKAAEIGVFDFNDALSLRQIARTGARLAVLVAAGLAIWLIWPEFTRRGMSNVLISPEAREASKAAAIEILNDSLKVEAGSDFLLQFRIRSGDVVKEAEIRMGNSSESADAVGERYQYLFRGVNSSVEFSILADGIAAGSFILEALKKPEIALIRLRIRPPGYTLLEPVTMEGEGNAEIPAGSVVEWSVRTTGAGRIWFTGLTDTIPFRGTGTDWSIERIVDSDLDYAILCKAENGLESIYPYRITVVKDLYPTIEIGEKRDTTISEDIFIQGVIQDDYGFTKLQLISEKSGREKEENIKISANSIFEEFYFTIRPDTQLTSYYFRIYDNDRINGPKFTDSRRISVRRISRSEIEEINSQLVDSITSDMADGMKAIEKLEKKISEFRMEQVAGELKPWEIQEKLKEMNLLRNEVMDFINQVNQANEEYGENEKLLMEDEQFLERAKEIRELLENLIDDELRELIKEFEELAKEFNKGKADELAEKLDMNMEKLKEQMEMSLELMKKYEMEKDLMKQVDQLNQMADSLMKEAEQNQKEGMDLKEKFGKWEEEYEKKLKEDSEFRKPMGLEKNEEERDEVKKAADEMKKEGSAKESSARKAKASKSLKKLAAKLQSKMGMMEGEGNPIDLEDLRQIRNALNDFSKRQEELNARIQRINTVNPTFAEVMKEEKDLEFKFLRVKDSLRSMGYEQPMITRLIGDELFHVETSFRNLFKNYSDNRASIVKIEQNRIMSEVNSIALKIDEMVKSMENSQGSGSGGKGFTDRKRKDKGDQPGSEQIGKTRSMQESLKQQLQNSIDQMKSGKLGKDGRRSLSEMLGQREMMRKALERSLQEGTFGTDAKEKANQAINMMKDIERDIVYNRLNDQTLKKDELIRTRLLEAENAEKERENDNRRESREFKGSFEPNRIEFEPDRNVNNPAEEMLKYKELKLKKFYEEKYRKYLESTKK